MASVVQNDSVHPFNAICEQWLQKSKSAKKVKKERFGQYAEEAMNFFDGNHDWMWKGEYAKGSGGFLDKEAQGVMPTFRMTVNRVFESVALFGPVLYHRNPVIQVDPKVPPTLDPIILGISPQDPQSIQQYQRIEFEEKMEADKRRGQAKIKEHYLNWLQHESDKKVQSRLAINEAIVKGMSTLWTEVYQPPGSDKFHPRSIYVSVDDIVIDPDAEYWEDVQWMARKVTQPLWQVEREYGLEGMLKGTMSSLNAQSEIHAMGRKETSGEKRKGKSFDLIEYWQVYTKCGFGDKLRVTDRAPDKDAFDYEFFGDFCYLAISEDIPYPLNVPSFSLAEDEQSLFMRAQWPIPFWTDGGWPFSRLHFYEKPKEVWPISLIKPAIGELRFVNWCMSFLADKVAAASTTYVAIAKAAGAEIQDQIKSGMGPYTVIEFSEIFGRDIREVISFLDAPSFNVDIWRMVSEVLEMIDKRTGLTELLYGLSGGTQIRSATEADVRNQNVSVRPDDMASRVEDWLSSVAMKEIEAAEWILRGEDVEPILGKLGAHVWDEQIAKQDFERTVRDYDYRIEAGSARKPNKVNRIRQLNEFAQIAMPVLQNFVSMGVSDPYNALMRDWAKANELDVEPYLIDMEKIQEQQQQEEQQPDPAQEAAMAEMQLKQQMMQLEMQEKQLDMQIKQQEASIKQQETQAKQLEFDFKKQTEQEASNRERQKIRMEQLEHEQGMNHDEEKHRMEIKHDTEKNRLEIAYMEARNAKERQAQ